MHCIDLNYRLDYKLDSLFLVVARVFFIEHTFLSFYRSRNSLLKR